ncbi:hypothetical protein [Williamsia muralis]|uniref:hypothetical protein n=1 Tax=Williamsia marianensis TaxID=85044 RepID=UPI001FB02C05|nr:hypothetical protein [Williamsia marianensis]
MLFVEKNKLLAALHFVSSQRHELLTGPNGRREQLIRCVGAGLSRELALKVFEQLTASLPGKETAGVRLRKRPQILNVGVGGVVQVRDASKLIGASAERRNKVTQMSAVAANLLDRVKTFAGTIEQDDVFGTREDRCAAPLLELDHNVGRQPSLGMG